MFAAKPTSRFVYLTVTLLLLLSFFVSITAYEISDGNGDGEDEFEGIEELIALDEEEESQQNQGSHVKSTEAEVIVKAQRIVLELNSDNTKRIIDGNEYVLVLGYAPWCPRSAELMPQFAEAATSLKELGSPLLMSKLDAERHPKTASSLGISGFPTLLLFTNGTSQPYTGGFSSWVYAFFVRIGIELSQEFWSVIFFFFPFLVIEFGCAGWWFYVKMINIDLELFGRIKKKI